MMITFQYEKRQVLQALRYHFISKTEIKAMIILVNVFAIASALLYTFRKVDALAFLVGSTLWIILMISFWFVLPAAVYRRSETFKHAFSMDFSERNFTLRHEHGSRSWPWTDLSHFIESPHFFHLYFDPRSFLLVPKSGFEGKAEVQEMRQLLRDKVGK